MRLHDMIVDRDAYLNEEVGPLETEDGMLIVGHLYRHNNVVYRLDRMTRRGWYGLSASTSLPVFVEWRWTSRNPSNPRRVVAAPYPIKESDRVVRKNTV